MFKELIWVKKKSLSKTFCDKVIDKFEKEPRKHDGVVGSNAPRVDKSMKDTTDINITNISGWEEEDNIFYKALQEGLEEYEKYLKNIHYRCIPNSQYKMKDAGYKLQKYEPNGFYDWHNDWCMGLKKNDDPKNFQIYIQELIDFCNKNNVVLLRTVGVMFADTEKRVSEYVN